MDLLADFELAVLSGDLDKGMEAYRLLKAVRADKSKQPKAMDYSHSFDGYAPEDHTRHIRFHEDEFRKLQAQFLNEKDPEVQALCAKRAAECAQHWQAHRVAKHTPVLNPREKLVKPQDVERAPDPFEALAKLRKAFDPAEPRDEQGRWKKGLQPKTVQELLNLAQKHSSLWKNHQDWAAEYAVVATTKDPEDGLSVVRRENGYEILFNKKTAAYGVMTAKTLYGWMERTSLQRVSRQADSFREELHRISLKKSCVDSMIALRKALGEPGWIGFDMDKTLATHEEGKGDIGLPIRQMVDRVTRYRDMGIPIRIVTARASDPGEVAKIRAWGRRQFGAEFPVTARKDPAMIALYDDKAIAVEPNTGRVLGGKEPLEGRYDTEEREKDAGAQAFARGSAEEMPENAQASVRKSTQAMMRALGDIENRETYVELIEKIGDRVPDGLGLEIYVQANTGRIAVSWGDWAETAAKEKGAEGIVERTDAELGELAGDAGFESDSEWVPGADYVCVVRKALDSGLQADQIPTTAGHLRSRKKEIWEEQPPAKSRVGDVRNYGGLPVRVENEAGSLRRGVDLDGEPWEALYRFPYGEIVGTMGADGDPVDVILGPDRTAPMVYILHQHAIEKVRAWPGGACPRCGNLPRDCAHDYDEDKIGLGFLSPEEFRVAYQTCYDDPDRFGGPVTELPVLALQEWLDEKRGRILKAVDTARQPDIEFWWGDVHPLEKALKLPKFHPLIKTSPLADRGYIYTPWKHQPFVAALKSAVPGHERKWNGAENRWEFHPKHLGTVANLAHAYWDASKHPKDEHGKFIPTSHFGGPGASGSVLYATTPPDSAASNTEPPVVETHSVIFDVGEHPNMQESPPYGNFKWSGNSVVAPDGTGFSVHPAPGGSYQIWHEVGDGAKSVGVGLTSIAQAKQAAEMYWNATQEAKAAAPVIPAVVLAEPAPKQAETDFLNLTTEEQEGLFALKYSLGLNPQHLGNQLAALTAHKEKTKKQLWHLGKKVVQSLEKKGLAEWNDPIYQITPAGMKILSLEKSVWHDSIHFGPSILPEIAGTLLAGEAVVF